MAPNSLYQFFRRSGLAHNINVISVEKISSLANSMIFATATSAKTCNALSENLLRMSKNSGEIVLGVEAMTIVNGF